MTIYGVAILAGSVVVGLVVGEALGWLIGVEANVGGVGVAMLLLIFLTDKLRQCGRLSPPTEQGVLFWSSIYIPIVVAMAACQNVAAALRGGLLALLAGGLTVAVCFAFVPLIAKFGSASTVPAESEHPHE